MKGLVDESVGKNFDPIKLEEARDRTLDVLLAVAEKIKPGLREEEVIPLLERQQKALGIEKIWHAPQIRFGENTLCPYGRPGIKNNLLNKLCPIVIFIYILLIV